MSFVVVNNVLHLQIQEGVLKAEWQVGESEWKPVEQLSQAPYDISDKNNHPSLDLGDARIPYGHILTGVKFFKTGGRCRFTILSRKFDHVTGLINVEGAATLTHVEPAT